MVTSGSLRDAYARLCGRSDRRRRRVDRRSRNAWGFNHDDSESSDHHDVSSPPNQLACLRSDLSRRASAATVHAAGITAPASSSAAATCVRIRAPAAACNRGKVRTAAGSAHCTELNAPSEDISGSSSNAEGVSREDSAAVVRHHPHPQASRSTTSQSRAATPWGRTAIPAHCRRCIAAVAACHRTIAAATGTNTWVAALADVVAGATCSRHPERAPAAEGTTSAVVTPSASTRHSASPTKASTRRARHNQRRTVATVRLPASRDGDVASRLRRCSDGRGGASHLPPEGGGLPW
jgi:hypothetical protein